MKIFKLIFSILIISYYIWSFIYLPNIINNIYNIHKKIIHGLFNLNFKTMIGLLFIILLIVAIVAISRNGKRHKAETKKLEIELENIPPLQQAPINVTDELIKLKQLLDTDIITQEEFEIQKKRILGN